MTSDVSRRRNSVIDLFQVDYVGKERHDVDMKVRRSHKWYLYFSLVSMLL